MNPFQPDDLVAAYEWHPFPQFRPGREHRDCFLAVSTPGHAEFPQQGAVWDGQVFRNPADEAQVLTGVTFWAGLPATPEPLMTLAAVLFGWWLRGRRQKS